MPRIHNEGCTCGLYYLIKHPRVGHCGGVQTRRVHSEGHTRIHTKMEICLRQGYTTRGAPVDYSVSECTWERVHYGGVPMAGIHSEGCTCNYTWMMVGLQPGYTARGVPVDYTVKKCTWEQVHYGGMQMKGIHNEGCTRNYMNDDMPTQRYTTRGVPVDNTARKCTWEQIHYGGVSTTEIHNEGCTCGLPSNVLTAVMLFSSHWKANCCMQFSSPLFPTKLSTTDHCVSQMCQGPSNNGFAGPIRAALCQGE